MSQIVAEVAVIPLGTATPALSRYVVACLEVLRGQREVKYKVTAAGTIMEGPVERVLELVRQMHEVPFGLGAQRVITTLKMDDRRDRPHSIASIEEAVGAG